jgi:hypothetical protein
VFIGFIPIFVAFISVLASLKNERRGRVGWTLTLVLVVIWTLAAGSHHLPQLETYGAW